MNYKVISLSALLILIATFAFSQHSARKGSPAYSIRGTVVDHATGNPMEYATIVLLSPEDSSQVEGIASDFNGHFQLGTQKPGEYILEVLLALSMNCRKFN